MIYAWRAKRNNEARGLGPGASSKWSRVPEMENRKQAGFNGCTGDPGQRVAQTKAQEGRQGVLR